MLAVFAAAEFAVERIDEYEVAILPTIEFDDPRGVSAIPELVMILPACRILVVHQQHM